MRKQRMNKQLTKKNLIVLSLLSSLAACGSDSNSTADTTPPTPPVDPCSLVLPSLPADASAHWENYLNTRTCSGLYNGEASTVAGAEVLPDFSYAGYKHGDERYQDVDRSGYTTYNVTDYGLIAGDGLSDKAALKALIDKVAADKQSGAVAGAIIYFPTGRYILNDSVDAAEVTAALAGLVEGTSEYASVIKSLQPIIIKDSNIILKGDGSSQSILYSDVPLLPEKATDMWTTPYLLQITGSSTAGSSSVIKSTHQRGTTKTITVADASQFSVGDAVELEGTTTNVDAISKLVSPYNLEKKSGDEHDYVWSQLTNGSRLVEKHIISEISGNNVTFNTPVLHEISTAYDWDITQIVSLDNVGVEGLMLQGNWQTPFEHHGSAEHDSGFSMLQLNRIHNSWVNDVEIKDFSQGINLKNSFNVTMESIALTGTQGHTALSVQVSNNTLVKDVVDTAKTWHAPGLSNYTVGNVYLNVTYDETASNDLHGAQSMYNLFDDVTGGFVYGRWGASTPNQPNHLKGLIYWNPVNTSTDLNTNTRFQYMRGDSEFGRVIMPYIVGMTGNAMTFASQYTYSVSTQAQFSGYADAMPDTPQAFVESMGTTVYPASLYEAQLAFRQGLAN